MATEEHELLPIGDSPTRRIRPCACSTSSIRSKADAESSSNASSSTGAARRFDVAAPVNHRQDSARLKYSMRFAQQCQRIFDMQQVEDHDVALRAIRHARALLDEGTSLGMNMRQSRVPGPLLD